MSREARELLILASWCQWSVVEQDRLSARDLWAYEQLQRRAAQIIAGWPT